MPLHQHSEEVVCLDECHREVLGLRLDVLLEHDFAEEVLRGHVVLDEVHHEHDHYFDRFLVKVGQLSCLENVVFEGLPDGGDTLRLQCLSDPDEDTLGNIDDLLLVDVFVIGLFIVFFFVRVVIVMVVILVFICWMSLCVQPLRLILLVIVFLELSLDELIIAR